jgi:hypothetical protein
MLARLQARSESPAAAVLKKASHLLIIAPAGIALPTLPLHEVLEKTLARRRKKAADLAGAAPPRKRGWYAGVMGNPGMQKRRSNNMLRERSVRCSPNSLKH